MAVLVIRLEWSHLIVGFFLLVALPYLQLQQLVQLEMSRWDEQISMTSPFRKTEVTSNTHHDVKMAKTLRSGLEYNFGDYLERDKKTNYTTYEKDDTSSSRLVIFYNAYLNPINRPLSDGIIREQLGKRRMSPLASNATLFYATIGDTTGIKKVFERDDLCKPCQHLGHWDVGFEEITLQAVHDYCNIRPMDRVLYIHNKGSFSDTETNRRLQKHLTKAVFSDECLTYPKTEFNLCTAKFTGFPFAGCVGNIFVVDCEYVVDLIPPKDFEQVKIGVHHRMMADPKLPWSDPKGFAKSSGSRSNSDPMNRDSWVGLGRYAIEHWVGSHPELRPSSVYPHFRFNYNFVPPKYDWVPKLQSDVRINVLQQRIAPGFFRRQGRLYLYNELYGVLPDKNSWVYQFYYV